MMRFLVNGTMSLMQMGSLKKTFYLFLNGYYVLFSLYFVLNDLQKSQAYFEWYEDEFSDDVGEPIQKLCWALSLHRMGRAREAEKMLAETMLSNLYLIPHLLGQEVAEYDIWHSSSDEYKGYVEYLPQQVKGAVTEAELQWVKTLYESSGFRQIRQRYVEIYRELQSIEDYDKRRKLLDEAHALLEILDD